MPPHAHQLQTGAQVGPYVISEILGEGASATVYRATNPSGGELALKVRPRGQSAADRLFLREFESLRTIRVPGVVQVHEAGLDGNHVWFSMDLVEGSSFVEAIRTVEPGPRRIARTVDLGRQLLDVLDALHQASFIHRDIKPSNVLVDQQGRVRLLDFGIAQVFEDRDTTRSTHSSQMLQGTLPYMAPEQLAALPLTPAADVFGCALMLHEALSSPRERPAHAFAWIAKTCMFAPPALATLDRDIPLGLSKVIENMLDIDPGRRPAAREAARSMRMLEAGMDPLVWPEPAFADPGPWWEPLESAVTRERGPRAWLVEGPAGSGRSRLTDQLKRLATMQGAWPVEVSCRVDEVGGAVRDLLEALLRPIRREPWSHRVMRPHTALLRRVWPTLPLSGSDLLADPPSGTQVAETVAALIEGVSEHHALLIVVKRGEHVDRLSAQVLTELVRSAGERVGLVVHHDRRWQTRNSQRLAHKMVTAGAGHLRMRTPSPAAQQAICASLCPHSTPVAVQGSPLRAVEAGLARLARWRGINFPVAAGAPWALAIRQTPLPTEVLNAVAGKGGQTNPWTREGEYGWLLESSLARRSVLSGLDDLAGAASRLADAWQSTGLSAHSEIAALRLMSDEPDRAGDPALAAARRAVRKGRFAEARRWLQVIETLSAAPAAAFELAALQAEVARVTDPGAAPSQLLARAEGLASTGPEEARVQLLAAELSLTEGHARTALVSALKLASTWGDALPELKARALLVATAARLEMGSTTDASRELERAKPLIDRSSPAHLRVGHQNLKADLALASGDLVDARQRSRQALRLASEAGNLAGAARCSARLARLLRQLGRRRQAEDYARAARDAYQDAGELRGHVGTTLALATLAAERCDAAIARPLLDESVRRIRGLQLTHLLPGAMRLALELATISADSAEANVALAALDPSTDEEAPAAIIRWWRTRGETDRALAVPAPRRSAWGRAQFHVQRALALSAAGAEVGEEARAARDLADAQGFAEIAMQARLLTDQGPALDQVIEGARRSLHAELHLGALAQQARSLSLRGDPAARGRWETLVARARQLGHRPTIEDAEGWLEAGT